MKKRKLLLAIPVIALVFVAGCWQTKTIVRPEVAAAPPQAGDHRMELAGEIQLAQAAADEFGTRRDHRLHQLRLAFAIQPGAEAGDRGKIQTGIVVQ